MNRSLDQAVGVPLVKILSLFSRAPKNKPEIKRLLLIKLAAVGDTIVLIPVLRALRQSHPSLQIDWLISPINQQIAKTVPYINNFIVWPKSLGSLWPLVNHLRAQKYDAVIDFEQWARGTALLSYFSGAPLRSGFDTPGQHRAGVYTHRLIKTYAQHERDDFFALARLLFDVPSGDALELFPNTRGMEEVRLALEGVPVRKPASLRVLVHPGCGADGAPREWPLSKYAVLIHWLEKRYAAQIFLTGGPEEKRKTADLNKLIGGHSIDLGGKLSWLGTISLLNEVDLVVSGNTGIMHLAAAAKKKQVALHGPTSSLLWGPLNPLARVVKTSCPNCPCLKLGFEYHEDPLECMKKIEVEQVKEAVESLI